MKKYLFQFRIYLFFNILVLLINGFINFFIPKILSLDEFGLYRKILVYISYAGVFSLGIGEYIYCFFSDPKYNYGIEDFSKSLRFLFNFYIVLFLISLLVGLSSNNFIFIISLLIIFYNFYYLFEIFYNSQREFRKINLLRINRIIIYVTFLLIFFSLSKLNVIVIFISLTLSYFVVVLIEFRRLGLLTMNLKKKALLVEEINKIKFGMAILVGNFLSIYNNNFDKTLLSFTLTNDKFGIYIFPNLFFLIFREFVQSLKTFLFPNLNLLDDKKKIRLYSKISYYLIIIFIIGSISLLPLKLLIKFYYPNYKDSIELLPAFYTAFCLEAFNQIIHSNFIQSFKLEKLYLITNFILSIFFSMSFILMIYFNTTENLYYFGLAYMFLMFFRFVFLSIIINKNFILFRKHYLFQFILFLLIFLISNLILN